ncbi:hypothetical protein [Pseudomonas sp. GCEP-101]|uniref:hypothetical protein n=1 Tax=Pseudomonas sp. GCEP-101 TaxID=2974552 RepID=UPI00223B8890|nr:hypothetical protein [Pseudomonas sp. GCEP-101]
MIPYGLTPDQFCRRYRRYLQRSTPTTIAALRALLVRPLPDQPLRGDVQLFLGENGLDTPDAWLYLSGENNKVDASDPTLFAGKALDLQLGLEDAPEFDPAYFEEDFQGVALIANTLKSWFAECWWKAGGWSWPVALTLAVHDGFGDGERIPLTESA